MQPKQISEENKMPYTTIIVAFDYCLDTVEETKIRKAILKNCDKYGMPNISMFLDNSLVFYGIPARKCPVRKVLLLPLE